jgi:hypothetical protein
MTQVQIIPNPKTGSVVTAYQNNPEFGYVQLQQTAMTIDGGWVREAKRSTLLRAKMELLSKFIAGNKTLALPGNIVVKEYAESDVPEDMAARFFNKSVDYEASIEPYVKRAGQDGIELTNGGERIIRFSVYDPSGKDTDVTVAHDNVAEVRESIAARSNANANLG